MIDVPRGVHLTIIHKQFPGITLDDMTLDAGGDHHVYIVHESVVFRFPQVPRRIAPVREHAIDWLAASGTVLFALPACEIRHDPEFDIWFERVDYIPGASFIPAVAATFTHDAMMAIARQMAAFLNAVHALPIAPAREIGMDEMDPTDFWDYMENNPHAYPWVQRTLWPIVTAAERSWIEHLFEGFIAQVRHTPMPLAICHNDMFPYHIIVNARTQRISGVIDFRWRITDPAGDFKAFEYYGPAFLGEVYAHYRHPVDSGFDSRRLFSTGHDKVFALVRALDAGSASGDATRIARRRESLSAYIRAHPMTGDSSVRC